MYGLKQSPRLWYERFDEFMLKEGFNRCNFGHCVDFQQTNLGVFIYFLLYVDDMEIACKDKGKVEKLKLVLNSEFEMKDLGPTKMILEIDIKRDRVWDTCIVTI